MLCFEVQINGDSPVTAGAANISVLSAIVSYVAPRDELTIRISGLVSHSEYDNEHLEWTGSDLRVGDSILIRVVDSPMPSEPSSRKRDDPELIERSKRDYFEHLKKKFGD